MERYKKILDRIKNTIRKYFMSIESEKQALRNRISAIQTILSDVNYLKTDSYSLNTGQGSQSAKYRPLKDLRMELDELEAELANLEGNGLLSVDFVRQY
jgi:predicted  nucleic acid-binding Zn-ribbon protein